MVLDLASTRANGHSFLELPTTRHDTNSCTQQQMILIRLFRTLFLLFLKKLDQRAFGDEDWFSSGRPDKCRAKMLKVLTKLY